MSLESHCKQCGQPISQVTQKRTDGLCIHCFGLASSRRETLQLLCIGCSRKYMLGVDAIVTEPEDVVSKVGGWIGDILSAYSYPDVIGPLEKPTSLDVKQPPKEREVIRTLQEAIRIGTHRKWRCFKCGRVQEYEQVRNWGK